jgi:hypothetical protein
LAAFNEQAIVKRIDELLTPKAQGIDNLAFINTVLQGTLTLLEAVRGPHNQHQIDLLNGVDAARKAKGDLDYMYEIYVLPPVTGALKALKADVQAGLIGDLRQRAAGEVMADMLALAKEALASGSDGAKNVAAVLAAGTYEDTIRRMGRTFANVQDRRDLSKVLEALKSAKVIEGAPFTTAQSYLKFRNDALHADWGKIDHAVVGSCIAFVEHLLLKHFS